MMTWMVRLVEFRRCDT